MVWQTLEVDVAVVLVVVPVTVAEKKVVVEQTAADLVLHFVGSWE
jgi:hypothetical protein